MGSELPNHYRPIACSYHDRLESWATLRTPVSIRYRDDTGALIEASGHIADVYARQGAEFLRLDSGTEIRLDRLESVTEESRR